MPHGNLIADLRGYSGKQAVSGSFYLHHCFVGLNFQQGLALCDLLALFLPPGQQLAGFLRHFKRWHDNTYRHNCFLGLRRVPLLQSVAPTPSFLALASTISTTRLLGGCSFSRVVESGPLTVK